MYNNEFLKTLLRIEYFIIANAAWNRYIERLRTMTDMFCVYNTSAEGGYVIYIRRDTCHSAETEKKRVRHVLSRVLISPYCVSSCSCGRVPISLTGCPSPRFLSYRAGFELRISASWCTVQSRICHCVFSSPILEAVQFVLIPKNYILCCICATARFPFCAIKHQ